MINKYNYEKWGLIGFVTELRGVQLLTNISDEIQGEIKEELIFDGHFILLNSFLEQI